MSRHEEARRTVNAANSKVRRGTKFGLAESPGEYNGVLVRLAARLISTDPSEIGQEIEWGLKLTGEFWHLDRILIIQVSDGGKDTSVIYSYLAPGIPSPLAHDNDTTPWLMERIRAGETIRLSHLPDDLPKEARIDRRYCRKEGVKSCLVLPYRVGDSTQGGLIFSSLRNQHPWPEELVEQLHNLGQIIASALERKAAAESIAKQRLFERLLSEVSAKYINLPINQIENDARSDFGRLSRLLDVDRCVLHLPGPEGTDWMAPAYAWEKTAWWPDEDVVRAMFDLPKVEKDVIEDLRYLSDKWSKGEVYRVNYPDELTEDAQKTKRVNALLGMKSVIAVPIMLSGATAGCLAVGTTRTSRIWPDEIVPKLRLFGEVFINALARKRSEESLRAALDQVKQLKEHFEADYKYLREEINLGHDFQDIIGSSHALREVLSAVRRVAPVDATVLLLGETGTGKGLFARAIHNASGRRDRPLIQVNCAALAPTLIESELFGHEKGAFTGAHTRKIGRFELARDTTLFLDEIAELPLDLQAKLLRVLQEGEFERVGGTMTIKTNARVIAATNRDLQKEVDAGRFRPDLWYRLNVFPIRIPALSDRLEDIPDYVSFFVNKYGKRLGKKFDRISQKSIAALQRYSWPGNVRELENLVERAVITSPGEKLEIDIPVSQSGHLKKMKSLRETECDHILEVLEHTYWKIEGRNGAASILGLKPSTLRQRMKKLGIQRPGLNF